MRAHPTVVECLAAVPSATRPTARTLKRATRRAAASQAIFLADASKRLAGSLDLQVTSRCLADLSVPELGEACIVYLLADGHTVGQLAAAKHVDADREALLTALAQTAFREPHGWQPLLRAASSGRCAILSQLHTAALLGDGRPPHILLGELGIKTAILVPVLAGEHTLAVLVFLTDRTRHYTPTRVRLGQELASRFALALEAAHLYRACKASLDATQESLATTIHDVMSPLTCIKGTAQRLHRIKPSITDAAATSEFAGRLETIDAAVNRMAAALSSLLQTTRPMPDDWAKPECQRTDLACLVRRTVAVEQLMARQHSIRVGDALPCLEGPWDADRLERLLSNLIGNAVKYSAPGGCIEISLTCDLDNEGRWAVLRVADHGVGIPARDLPFVFEPFHRGSNVGSVSGTGLGLASVWQTVKACDGRLWLESEEGKGTRVTVRLPLDADPPLTVATSTPH
jgi:signal transduction histidine kinase